MLNEIEHLLVCLNEECCEIAKECTKALRFGLDDRNPEIENDARQREHIRRELCDLLGVIELLVARGVITDPHLDTQRIYFKKVRVAKFMRYAQNAGALARNS
jgi:NTP pyrophosphatase (non-canonical NTP hydrolase)